MQKIILLPKLTTKEHFFVSRLVVFNVTFASMTGTEDDHVILWHEAIAGRLAENVASAYIKCIEMCQHPNIVLWVDNCSGQNKNWTLITTLAKCVNAEWEPQNITLKYLERGHTFMKADSIHGNIGKKMKKEPEVLTMPDFVDLCNKSSRKIKATETKVNDFYKFSDGHRCRQSKKVKIPLLSDISVLQFSKGKKSFFFQSFFLSVLNSFFSSNLTY